MFYWISSLVSGPTLKAKILSWECLPHPFLLLYPATSWLRNMGELGHCNLVPAVLHPGSFQKVEKGVKKNCWSPWMILAALGVQRKLAWAFLAWIWSQQSFKVAISTLTSLMFPFRFYILRPIGLFWVSSPLTTLSFSNEKSCLLCDFTYKFIQHMYQALCIFPLPRDYSFKSRTLREDAA